MFFTEVSDARYRPGEIGGKTAAGERRVRRRPVSAIGPTLPEHDGRSRSRSRHTRAGKLIPAGPRLGPGSGDLQVAAGVPQIPGSLAGVTFRFVSVPVVRAEFSYCAQI